MIADRFRVTGRVAVITGAGRGIGAATAVALAQAGADVVISARTEDQLAAVAREVEAAGRRAVVVPADLSDPAAAAGLAAAAVEAFGRLDIVVNNVGGALPRPFLATTPRLSMGSGLKRIALDRGTIHTYIWAPPGQFVVDTPSAVTVDLGCAYTLQVDDSGAGMVRTSLGWVGFKLNGHESFIPAGAACATRPKVGPGTPYFEDSSAEFRGALTRFDFEDSTPEQRAHDVAIVLSQARNRDALTLWHLLARVEDQQRVLVYDRLSQFVPPPATLTKEGILRLDQPMLDQWWNELGFDDISVWRHWERSWAGTATPVREK